jgi:hypothetical protein
LVKRRCGANAVPAYQAPAQKHDVFVLDFMNDMDTIHAAFATTPARRLSVKKRTSARRLPRNIDMDSYQGREVRAMRIALADENANSVTSTGSTRTGCGA